MRWIVVGCFLPAIQAEPPGPALPRVFRMPRGDRKGAVSQQPRPGLAIDRILAAFPVALRQPHHWVVGQFETDLLLPENR